MILTENRFPLFRIVLQKAALPRHGAQVEADPWKMNNHIAYAFMSSENGDFLIIDEDEFSADVVFRVVVRSNGDDGTNSRIFRLRRR